MNLWRGERKKNLVFKYYKKESLRVKCSIIYGTIKGLKEKQKLI